MKHSVIIAAACTLLVGAAHAATNGTLGTTSTGTQNVAVTVQDPADNRVRVSGLFDVNLGVINPGESNRQFSSFCFFHTSPTFSLTVQQSESDSGFALLNPVGGSIPLELSLSLQDASGLFITYLPQNGVTRTGLIGNRSSDTCNSGFSSSGNYTATSAIDQAAGSYTGTVTFVMAVE